MENLQIDLRMVFLAVCGLCGLCVIGVVLSFGLQVFGIVFEVLGTLIEFVTGFISGGPVAWCGCIFALLGLGGCALLISFVTSTLSACGTPQATNFCALFGR